MKIKRIILFILIIIVSFVIEGKTNTQKKIKYPYLQAIMRTACSVDQQQTKIHWYTTLINRLSDKSHAKEAIQSTACISCFLEYPNYLSSISFNLANYAYDQKLNPDIIKNLTRLLSIRTFGKKDYMSYARLWQHLKNTGLANHLIKNIFYTALTKRYRAVAIEGLSVIYLSLRQKKMNHKEALVQAIKKSILFKRSVSKTRVFQAVIELDKKLEMTAPFSKKLINPPPSEFDDNYWEQVKNKISKQKRIQININKQWDVQQLEKDINFWKNTSYKYGGMSKKGIDNYSLIQKVFQSQFPEINLPLCSKDFLNIGKKINISEIKSGDIISFSGSQTKKNTYLGIYISKGMFAHVSKQRGVTVSKLNQKYYKDKIFSINRIIR